MNLVGDTAGLGGTGVPKVLAIGVFDGVHLGHRAVLERAVREASACGGEAVAVTFDPHPARVLRPQAAPRLLTATAHKLRLIEGLGYGRALVLPFDERFAATPAVDFLEQLARGAHPLRAVVVGCGWRFGRGREGTVDLIRSVGAQRGFEAVEMPAVVVDGLPVSSTRIREAVEAGDLAGAARCLGRDYAILGTVVHGRQAGRMLGFPTANLRAHNEQFPPDGVYVVQVGGAGGSRLGVANVGFRPTLDGAGRTLEVHLLDFEGDLYGRNLEVAFRCYLRPERKFPGVAELREQIARDVAAARALENPAGAITVPS